MVHTRTWYRSLVERALTKRQKECNHAHDFYRAGIEHLFAWMWHCEEHIVSLHFQQFLIHRQCGTLSVVYGYTYLHMWGLHVRVKTLMTRTL